MTSQDELRLRMNDCQIIEVVLDRYRSLLNGLDSEGFTNNIFDDELQKAYDALERLNQNREVSKG